MAPLVSVVIPVYNGANYLGEAIKSVLDQTFSDCEIVVVDDGSTDTTWEIIQSYGDRVRGLRKANGGVASALNLGIKSMRGKWFAWLSHDDLWLPAKLEKQLAFLEAHPQFRACYTDYYTINPTGTIIRSHEVPWYPKPRSLRTLFGQMYIGGCTMMVDRSCFDSVGLFNEGLRTTQDVEMWFRILRHYEIGHLAEKLTKQRVHPGQDSRTVPHHETEKQSTYTRLFEEIGWPVLFPEIGDWPPARAAAKACTWFGNTMAYHRGWYYFADEQYRKAISIFPSWRNPARLMRIVNQGLRARPCLQRFLHPGEMFRKKDLHETS